MYPNFDSLGHHFKYRSTGNNNYTDLTIFISMADMQIYYWLQSAMKRENNS